jgi:hypothetical protein
MTRVVFDPISIPATRLVVDSATELSPALRFLKVCPELGYQKRGEEMTIGPENVYDLSPH